MKAFSRLTRCRTGHTHIGEYYPWFVRSKTLSALCPLAKKLHVQECRRYATYTDPWACAVGKTRGDNQRHNVARCSIASEVGRTVAFGCIPTRPRGNK